MSFSNTSSISKNLHPNSVRIGLMDPNIAKIWAQRVLSNGTTVASIKKGDTINHTTSQPIANGLFCQRIFGPCSDYTCACGHEKIRIHVNVNVAPPVCPDCHVEWTVSSVRRQRLGSIELLSPVTHKWFSDSRNYIPILSGIAIKTYKSLKECKLFFPFLSQVVETTPVLNQVKEESKNYKKSFYGSSVPRVRTFKKSRPKEEVKVVTTIPTREIYKNSVSKNMARSMKNLQIMTKSLSGATHVLPIKQNFLGISFTRDLPAGTSRQGHQLCVSENELIDFLPKVSSDRAMVPKVCRNSLWSLDQDRQRRNKPSPGMLKKNARFYTFISTTEILQKNKQTRYLGLVPTATHEPALSTGPFLRYGGKEKAGPKRTGSSHDFTEERLAVESKVVLQAVDGRSSKQKNLLFDSSENKRVLGLVSPKSTRSALSSLWSPLLSTLGKISYVHSTASPKDRTITASGVALKKVKKTILSFPLNRCLNYKSIPVYRNTGHKQLTQLPNLQDNVYSDNVNSTHRQNQQNTNSQNLCTISKNSITKTCPPISNGHRSKEHLEHIQNLILNSSKLKYYKLKEKVIYKDVVNTKGSALTPSYYLQRSGRAFFCFGNKTQNSCSPKLLKRFPLVTQRALWPIEVSLPQSSCTPNRAKYLYNQFDPPVLHFPRLERKKMASSGPTAGTVERRLLNGSEPLLGQQKPKLSNPSSGCTFGSELFNCSHSYPTRPSFTQPEDYRRQFIKFMGNSGLIRLTDIPIVRYSHKNPLNFSESHQNLVQRGTLSTPFIKMARKSVLLQDRQDCFDVSHPLSPLWPKRIEKQLTAKDTDTFAHFNLKQSIQSSIDVFFSETKSAAKEETIKRILLQTGGGGIQKYLEKINLGMLIYLLQNDLFEIAPRLVKSQSTRRILAFIVNKTLKNIQQNYSLLEQIQTGSSTGMALASSVNIQAEVKLDSDSQSTRRHRNDTERSKPYSSVVYRSQVGKTNQLSLVSKIESLEKRYKDLKKEYKIVKKICSDFQNRKNANKRRYKLAFQLVRTMSNPAGMTLSSVPVLPPGLRPIIDVPKIGPITADLNIRYRALIFALRNLRELAYVDFRNTGAAQASVQEAVDDLLYTGGKPRREKGNTAMSQNLYKSLAIRLKGKHGRFRGNLLGKRVDYSGRSVIVVGPTLKIHQCGLPFEIAIKLFNPFLIRRLIQKGLCQNVYKAKQVLIGGKFKPLIWALCREVMLEHLVLLNRAPTLHRLGVQAFMPILVSGRAILLHPLVCTGFNADFDGDQMGVHVPLFSHPRAEAWKLMWSRNNFLSPSSGEPILLPSQDMVLGCYYLTESSFGELPLVVPMSATERPSMTEGRYLPAGNSIWPAEPRKGKIVSPILTFPSVREGGELCRLYRQSQNSRQIEKTPNNYFRPNTLLKPFTTTSQIQNAHFLSIKTILENYRRGFYTLQSHVWINSNKIVKKLEGGGFEGKIPALELRITPYGITRLLHPSGIKKSLFSTSTLLPVKKNSNSPFSICSIRTTIGRLLFNDVLNQFDIF